MRDNIKIKVTNQDILFDFLKKNLTRKSKNNIKSLLSKKHVYVNNKLQTKYNYIVYENDIVEIKTKEFIDKKINMKIEIIYEDKDIIVVNKPSGILTISTVKEKELTIYHLVMNYLKSKNKNNKVFIIHRLDKDTSGVLMFAKNEEIKNLFQKDWNNLVLERKYYAVIEGTLSNKKGIIKSYLKENKNHIVYSSNDNINGKLSITEYEVIKSNEKYSLVDINIKTGRKNQIRVHFSDLGNPIIGDNKYGSRVNTINRLALHAYKIKIIDPRNKKILVFTSELPRNMNKII